MTDKKIIEGIKSNNERNLIELYRYRQMVVKWVLKNSGSEDHANDLFQEALIIFYKNVKSGKYVLKSKISTYLFEICKRQWLTYLKKNKDKKISMDSYNYLKQESIEINPKIGSKNQNSLNDYINNAVNQLSESCQALIKSKIHLKMAWDDIAKEFGFSNAASARQQNYICMQKLRKLVSYKELILLS